MGVSAYRRGRMVRRMIDHADRWVIKRRATRVADRMAEQKADSTPREDADTPIRRRYVSAPRRPTRYPECSGDLATSGPAFCNSPIEATALPTSSPETKALNVTLAW